MSTAAQIQTLDFKDVRTYLVALIFICGNIVFPQLCHQIPRGGLIFLPIYFFTLIGAYKYGWKVGLITAVLSPLVNCLFFGMPPLASLPAILIKSVSLAIIAGLLSRKFGKLSFLAIVLSVIAYQMVGMTYEFIVTSNFNYALQDVRIGYPGILIQIFGGWGLLKAIERI